MYYENFDSISQELNCMFEAAGVDTSPSYALESILDNIDEEVYGGVRRSYAMEGITALFGKIAGAVGRLWATIRTKLHEVWEKIRGFFSGIAAKSRKSKNEQNERKIKDLDDAGKKLSTVTADDFQDAKKAKQLVNEYTSYLRKFADQLTSMSGKFVGDSGSIVKQFTNLLKNAVKSFNGDGTTVNAKTATKLSTQLKGVSEKYQSVVTQWNNATDTALEKFADMFKVYNDSEPIYAFTIDIAMKSVNTGQHQVQEIDDICRTNENLAELVLNHASAATNERDGSDGATTVVKLWSDVATDYNNIVQAFMRAYTSLKNIAAMDQSVSSFAST